MFGGSSIGALCVGIAKHATWTLDIQSVSGSQCEMMLFDVLEDMMT